MKGNVLTVCVGIRSLLGKSTSIQISVKLLGDKAPYLTHYTKKTEMDLNEIKVIA